MLFTDTKLHYSMVTTRKRGTAGVGSLELHLMRSYNHLRRSRTNPGQPIPRGATGLSSNSGRSAGNKRKTNYGNAPEDAIWQIARAAAAPPLYFEPMSLWIENDNNEGEFQVEDGGLSIHNNPTREAILDIKEQTGTLSLSHVISVGTAKESVTRPENPGLVTHIFNFIDGATNPEIIQDLVEGMEDTTEYNFKYFRFNATPTTGHVLKTKLDEWKPRSPAFRRSRKPAGHRTIEYIRRAFDQWFTIEEIRTQLHECAAELVRAPHARCDTDPARWERFAGCHKYTCGQSPCMKDPFINRDEFEAHLVADHGFAGNSTSLSDEVDRSRARFPYKAP